jgi:hypothetical protein
MAVLSAQLPWYVLPVLAGIPLVAWLLPLFKQAVWVQSLALALATFAFATGTIYLAWNVAGDVPF